MISLVWLRRDLRLHDHAALAAALERPEPVQPIFIFDTAILERFTNPHDRRLTFIAHTLVAMHEELKKRGGKLWVFHGEAEKIVPRLSLYFKANVFAAQDFEPETRRRDKHVSEHAPLYVVKDHLIFSPKEILKGMVRRSRCSRPIRRRGLRSFHPAIMANMPYATKGAIARWKHRRNSNRWIWIGVRKAC